MNVSLRLALAFVNPEKLRRGLPAFLLAKFCDVSGVVFSVPFINEK
jgi:hypothetical protein